MFGQALFKIPRVTVFVYNILLSRIPKWGVYGIYTDLRNSEPDGPGAFCRNSYRASASPRQLPVFKTQAESRAASFAK